jgi:hypothetical protein
VIEIAAVVDYPILRRKQILLILRRQSRVDCNGIDEFIENRILKPEDPLAIGTQFGLRPSHRLTAGIRDYHRRKRTHCGYRNACRDNRPSTDCVHHRCHMYLEHQ